MIMRGVPTSNRQSAHRTVRAARLVDVLEVGNRAQQCVVKNRTWQTLEPTFVANGSQPLPAGRQNRPGEPGADGQSGPPHPPFFWPLKDYDGFRNLCASPGAFAAWAADVATSLRTVSSESFLSRRLHLRDVFLIWSIDHFLANVRSKSLPDNESNFFHLHLSSNPGPGASE